MHDGNKNHAAYLAIFDEALSRDKNKKIDLAKIIMENDHLTCLKLWLNKNKSNALMLANYATRYGNFLVFQEIILELQPDAGTFKRIQASAIETAKAEIMKIGLDESRDQQQRVTKIKQFVSDLDGAVFLVKPVNDLAQDEVPRKSRCAIQ